MRLLAAILAITLLATCAMRAEQRTVSRSEFEALRAKILAHWQPDPPSFSQPDQYVVVVRFHLDRNGRLTGPPEAVRTGSTPQYRAAAEAAKRAIVLSQPFDMLSPSNYDVWKDVEVNFNPRESRGQRPEPR